MSNTYWYNGAMHRRTIMLWIALAVALGFALPGCSPDPTAATPTPSPTQAGTLIPYATATRSPVPSGQPSTPTPIPSATPTPVTYTVKKDDDMFGIALRYGIPLSALKTANPTVLPNFLSVGMVLVIPITPSPPATPAAEQASPVPKPVTLDAPQCYPSADGGLWCLALARNGSDRGLENVTASFRLAGSGLPKPSEQTGETPLNVLTAKGQLPLAVFFPGPIPRDYGVEAALQDPLPVPDADRRYLPARIENQSIQREGTTAEIKGEVRLDTGSGEAKEIWVLAVAYGKAGQVVGLRKWESGEPLPVGSALSFDLSVYSLGPAIERVETYVEAHS